MSYNLFLDDIRVPEMVYRNPNDYDFVIVRTFEKFVAYVEKHGLPKYISFDNDLGLNPNGKIAEDGYAAAKWLVYDSGLNLMHLDFYVHSANPVAAKQIESLLTNYINHLKSNQN